VSDLTSFAYVVVLLGVVVPLMLVAWVIVFRFLRR
jgi:hypothetical protein